MSTIETPSPRRRRLRYLLISLTAFALTIALFYAEEDFRGWLALKKCKRELAAQGISLDWSKRIPAPVPETENVFGVPQMQEWFTYRKPTALSEKLNYNATNNPPRMVIEHLTLGLPGATPPIGSAVFQCGDPKTLAQTTQLMKEALGPLAIDPAGAFYTKQSPADIQPVQVFLHCQTLPSQNELEKLIPGGLVSADARPFEDMKLERNDDGSYNLTMRTPMTVDDFLKWTQSIKPELDLIRNALTRPYARMGGDYSEPSGIPIPNFVTVRALAQRLSAMAHCHLLLGQPEEALGDLTPINDICRRVLEENQLMTLVSAMINVAARGLEANVISDGLQTHAWREPQLAALAAQLRPINLLLPVKKGFEGERFATEFYLSTLTPAEFFRSWDGPPRPGTSKNAFLPKLIPQGWSYQNMLTAEDVYSSLIVSLDPTNQIVFPDRENSHESQFETRLSHWSPYSFILRMVIPNFSKTCRTTALNQTKVNQTLIACALERYRLAHGEYPQTLDALVPEFIDAIPHDVIGGQPPHYSRNADGSFLLYSIGWDQLDHHGLKGTDWVWPEN